MWFHMRAAFFLGFIAACICRETQAFQTRSNCATVRISSSIINDDTSSHPLGFSCASAPNLHSKNLRPNMDSFTMNERTHFLSNTSLHMFRRDQETKSNLQTERTQTDEQEDLNKFRSLMGTLYGFAGIAHAIDCFFGPSQLLVSAGFPTFQELPLEGQALAVIWCLAGPLSFILSKQGQVRGDGKLADIGLIFYGAIEVGGAAFSPDASTVVNAFVVQAIVFVAWIYSSQKEVAEV